MPDNTNTTISEADWAALITRIRNGHCTPFLGAGMSSEKIPLGGQIAEKLALDPLYEYPFPYKRDLTKVAQYIALKTDASVPKELVKAIIDAAGQPDFTAAGEPHMQLAKLPLPLYITTNYDDFMYQALKRTVAKEPQRFISSWYEQPQYARVGEAVRQADNPGFDIAASVEKPAVYHFHGYKDDLDSMVLTEDDYLDFLVRLSRDQSIIPPRIQQAIGGTSLLFLGYSLNDMNFRVIFRGLRNQLSTQKFSVTVQIPPEEGPQVVEYLTKYFNDSKIRVYWGKAVDFVNELSRRWDRA
jgi:hypothetical protein